MKYFARALGYVRLRTDSAYHSRHTDEVDWIAAVTEWRCFRNEVRTHWVKLSESQLDTIAGERTRLAEEIRVSYGLTPDQAEQQIGYFEARNEYLRAISSR